MFNKSAQHSFEEYTRPNGSIELIHAGYKTFVPTDLPPVFDYDQDMILLLAKVERKMGELKEKGS